MDSSSGSGADPESTTGFSIYLTHTNTVATSITWFAIGN